MQFFTDFDDSFFYWALTAACVLTCIDFFLGETRRQKMRSNLETFWLHIEEMSYAGLAKEDALVVLQWLRGKFGNSSGEKHFIVRAMTVSGVISFLVISVYLGRLMGANGITIFVYPNVIIPNALADWISLAFTMWLLKEMSERGPNTLLLLGVIIADIIAAFVLSVVAIYSAVLIAEILPFAIGEGTRRSFLGLAELFLFGPPILLTCMLPTALHLGMSVIFLGSKLIRPLIQKTAEHSRLSLHGIKQRPIDLN